MAMGGESVPMLGRILSAAWHQPAREWIELHQEWFWWIGAASLVMTVLGALLLPWLICRLPEDYFTESDECRRTAAPRPASWGSVLLLVLRNGLGFILIIAGIMMLFLPGQGVLTILFGLLLLTLPAKRRIVCGIACRRSIRTPLNWIRAKRRRAPFRGLMRRDEAQPAKRCGE